jgi:membrane protease YdiL (CAAX protease family)
VRGDVKRVVVWFFVQLGVRILAGIALHVLAPHLPPGGNLGDLDDVGPAGAALLLVTAVIVAPLVEEVAFRGVLLRALMRRLHFWPAAALSSFLFALLHVPGSDTLGGSVQVAATIYAFALVQCELVRRTGRLAPAIGVHATMNLLATGVALAAS